MEPTSARFVDNARDAIADENLQLALARVGENFGAKRTQAIAALPEFDALRDRAVEIKDDVLGHLDRDPLDCAVGEASGQYKALWTTHCSFGTLSPGQF